MNAAVSSATSRSSAIFDARWSANEFLHHREPRDGAHHGRRHRIGSLRLRAAQRQMRAAIVEWGELRRLPHDGAHRKPDVPGDVVERPPVDHVVDRRILAVGAVLRRARPYLSAAPVRSWSCRQLTCCLLIIFSTSVTSGPQRRRHRQVAFHRFEGQRFILIAP